MPDPVDDPQDDPQDDPNQPPGDDLDADALKRELAKARNQAAQYRSQAKKSADALRAAQDATLSDQEKILKERDELKAQMAERDRQLADSGIRSATVAAAARLGFNDPEDAYALLNRSAIVTDDAGKATNLEELLKAILEAKPYLGRGEPAPRGGTSNPGPRTVPAGGLNMNEVLRAKVVGR